jgi:hypothetical protein
LVFLSARKAFTVKIFQYVYGYISANSGMVAKFSNREGLGLLIASG